ncbi:hypothetical protein ABIE26_004458 [Pedobacter africanus]|uniref:Uncharacterized protein n=1 Tax=Pedobacter africanus TaxID=151894 RepID=A0ACC6L3I6_9SPHI|nr:M43 family zinc metalloprotease [Pedobacter africanus]MDR6786072.1 hypothetical protein [Pedobacter africanus]
MKTFLSLLKIRKSISMCVLFILMLAACTKPKTLTDFANEVPVSTQRSCATDEHFENLIQSKPSIMQIRNSIEAQTQNFLRTRMQNRSIDPSGNITIPVFVHVIYSQSNENISLEQIQSQIDVLNRDFNAINTDFSSIPSVFQSVAADFQMSFVLKGVDRRASTQVIWDARAELYKSYSTGGLDAVSTNNTLNIWVCNLSNSGSAILGYGTSPGSVDPTQDGVAVSPYCFGTLGYLNYPFDAGRTTTHEVGHWLNLIHIWGNASCGTDLVDDTPVHPTENYFCPSFPLYSTCTGQNQIQMTMNYMDYTDDRCMFMFTAGQKARARALFEPNGYRRGFVTPTVLAVTGPSSVCPSNTATYTINNVPAGAVVTWNHTMWSAGSVVSTSGNSITIMANGIGYASIGATIVDPGYAYEVNSKQISLGAVTPGPITATTGPTIGCDRVHLEIAAVPGATSYKWYIDGAFAGETAARFISRILESDGVDHLIEVEAVSPCGTSTKRSTMVTGWCG